MVSMVIVLFLVAVAISLFFGRLAETLMNRFNEQSRRPEASESLSKPVAEIGGNKAA